jgi:hypothetical protein
MADEEDDQTIRIGNARYEKLLSKEAFVILLLKAGVESWEGYDAVMEDFIQNYGKWDLD